MGAPTKGFVLSAFKAAIVGIVAYVSVFVFRLGWFIPVIVLLGAVVALLVTAGERRASRRQALRGGVAILSYVFVTSALFWVLTGQVSYRTFEVTWHDYGSANHSGESEVFLEFSGFPGNGVGMYSNALRAHLASTGTPTTTVEFQMTSDNWCLRGFHEVRIGSLRDLSTLPRSGGYARGGSTPSPWEPTHWWCR
jgi:hypothetical protein